MQGKYGVFIRARDGQILARVNDFVSLSILDTLNDVGSWSIKSTTTSKCPFEAGQGVIVVRNNQYFYSGIVTQIQDNMDARTGLFTWEVQGVSDLGYLARRVCFVDPATGETTTYDHYRDTGILSDVVERLISKNLGADALEERIEPIVEAYSGQEVGETVSVELRFQNLLNAVTAVCVGNGHNVRARWDEETLKVYFEVFPSRDLSQAIVFTEQLNNIVESEYIGKVPEGNWVLAGGTGEMTEREFATAQNDSSIGEWGRIEVFQDVRNQHDVEGYVAEALSKKSDNMTGYSVTASDADNAPQYGTDYRLGDYVGAKIADRYVIAQVQQVQIDLSGGVEQISPKFGTVAVGKFREIFLKLDELRQDVNELLGTEIE